ncbi:MAG: Coenzyme F420 hydrogenase/dehydrogenase, beta subunit C-terminal domain [Thermodesulfobacteriota bacterium]
MEDLHGLDDLKRLVLERGLCASCGACVEHCPYLTSFRGRTVVLDSCAVEHGRCFTYCPMTFFDTDEASRSLFGKSYDADSGLGHVRDVVATRAGDESTAAMGQGGGTVTALMALAMERGLIDAAVLTGRGQSDPFPRGVVATTVPEIRLCSGSRYVGAHGLAALRDALDRGYQRIGVVGVPCQIRSLRKMALYDLKHEGLKERITLAMGLFCNWAFSSKDFATFLAARFGLEEIRRYHIPPPPANVLEVETSQGLTGVPLEELRPMIQAACGVCPDMTSEFADLSVGMYEGREGWNTAIVRTDAGRALFEMALDARALEVEPFPEANLSHLRQASRNKRTRASGA